MNEARQRQRVRCENGHEAEQVQDQMPPTQDWSQFWPTAAPVTGDAGETVIREIHADLERRGAIQDRLAGYRSESQGE